MATLTRGYTFGTTETVTAAKLHSLVDSATISAISASDLAAGAVTGSKILMGSDTRGDLLYFNGTAYARLPAGTSGQFLKSGGAGADPSWDTPSGLATFASPTVTLSATASAGALGTTLRSDCVIAAFDATLPVTLAIGDSAATGDAAFAARRNHVHGMPTFAAPALTFSTTNGAGVATTLLRSDAQIAIFDATAPVTQAFGDAAATGSAGTAARRDHKHGMPANPGASGNTVTFYSGTTSVSVTVATGESVVIFGSVAGKKGTGSGSVTVTLTLKRGSTSIATGQYAITSSASDACFAIPIAATDSPSAGTYSYNLSISDSGSPSATADVYAIMAIKKSA